MVVLRDLSPAGRGARATQAGFTLLEVIAAIAIAAILLGVSVPAMQRLYESSQYRGAVADVVGLLSSARYTAIRSGEAQDVVINPRSREVSAGRQVKSLPESVSVEIVGAAELNRDGVGVIRFYPDGGASGGFVSLTHESGMASQVQVDWLLGKVTTCTENCAELPL